MTPPTSTEALVRKLLADDDTVVIGQEPAPPAAMGGVCDFHIPLAIGVRQVKDAIPVLAGGLDEVKGMLFDVLKQNGQQNVDIAVLKTKIFFIGSLGGIVGSLVVGLTLLGFSRLLAA